MLSEGGFLGVMIAVGEEARERDSANAYQNRVNAFIAQGHDYPQARLMAQQTLAQEGYGQRRPALRWDLMPLRLLLMVEIVVLVVFTITPNPRVGIPVFLLTWWTVLRYRKRKHHL